MSIDNYFISEQEQRSGNKTQILMKYEFDKSMDDVYQRSLVKAFKKTLDDGLFNFVIVDMVNNRMSLLDEINLHATLRGYKLYVIELTSEDVHTCHRRNTHNRSLSEIQQLADNWDKLPAHYVKIDLKGFAPSAAGETEATDMSLDSDSENGMEPLKAPLRTPQGGGGGLPPKSKWETSSKDDEQAAESKKSDRESGCKREPLTLEEYLDDSDLLKTNSPTKSKKIRWQDDDAAAPMEKDMGFYIGQSPRSRTNLIASNPNVIKSSPSNVPFDKYKY